ncbi:MAG: hypothetical protein ACE5F9_04160, partial [Phycisphaerae bacterium]
MASSNVILREPAAIGSTVTLEDLYDRGDHYALLRVALARIADDPDDVGLAVLVCRSYIALGLIGPAREMLSAESRPLGSMPELRSLCEQIVSMPSGAIPWDELRTRFEQNVARIVERHPALSRHEAVFRTIPDRLELYRTRDGNLLVRDRSSGVGHGWLPDFGNTREMVERVSLPHDADALFCDPYVVLYDRFGAMFRRVFEATRKMLLTFSPRIYVVEPDPRMFGVALYTAESVESLCHDRTSVFVGDDWSEDLGAYLRSHPERAVPGYMVDLATPDAVGRAAVEAVSREALESRQRHAAAVVKSVRRLYDALPSGGWARRFEAIRNGGLRLIGFTSRFTTVLQYSMRDLKAAFESRGHTFRIVTEVSDHDLVSPASHVAAVEDVHPDLILNIDHLRSEQGDAFPKNVPFVSWLQDLLPNLTCEEAGRSIGPTDFYIAAGLTELVTRYRYPASQGMAWTMATNEAVYDSEPMPVEALAPHRCDFSYVSNQTEPPHRLHERWLETVRDLRGGSRLLEHVYAALCES